jgi:hypothetical protein
MNREPRILRASLIAPFAILLPLALLAAATIVWPERSGTALADDAPVRAAGLMLNAVIPLAYPILALAMFGVSSVLSANEQLTRKNLIYLSVLVSARLACWLVCKARLAYKTKSPASASLG